MIALDGIGGAHQDASLFAEDIVFLGEDTADQIGFGKVGIKGIELVPGEGLEDGLIEYLDVLLCWLLVEKAIDRDHQFPLGSEPTGGLFSVLVDGVGA